MENPQIKYTIAEQYLSGLIMKTLLGYGKPNMMCD